METTVENAKQAARVLRSDLAAAGMQMTHGQALEVIAHQLGHQDWNTAVARLSQVRQMGPAVPVLRIQDEALAKEFYLDYLGFGVEWEHRFEPELPLYARLRCSGTVIDLSGHHGDGVPGATVWVPVADVGSYRRELLGKNYTRMRPGIDKHGPGGPTMEVTDPFSNTLRFCQIA